MCEMPVKAVGGKIIEVATGKVKGRGHGKTQKEREENAKKSARARNAALHGWKPTKKK